MKGVIFPISVAFLISVGILLCFNYILLPASKTKIVNADSVNIYKQEIKNEHSDIKDIKVYCKFGRIIFDIKLNPSMSANDYISIVKKTKEFVSEEGITSIVPEGYDEQQTIRVQFNTKGSSCYFESPYWITTEATTDNPNEHVKNNYKVWFKYEDNIMITQMEL